MRILSLYAKADQKSILAQPLELKSYFSIISRNKNLCLHIIFNQNLIFFIKFWINALCFYNILDKSFMSMHHLESRIYVFITW